MLPDITQKGGCRYSYRQRCRAKGALTAKGPRTRLRTSTRTCCNARQCNRRPFGRKPQSDFGSLLPLIVHIPSNKREPLQEACGTKIAPTSCSDDSGVEIVCAGAMVPDTVPKPTRRWELHVANLLVVYQKTSFPIETGASRRHAVGHDIRVFLHARAFVDRTCPNWLPNNTRGGGHKVSWTPRDARRVCGDWWGGSRKHTARKVGLSWPTNARL